MPHCYETCAFFIIIIIIIIIIILLHILRCHKTSALCVLSKPCIAMKYLHYLSQHMADNGAYSLYTLFYVLPRTHIMGIF